MRADIERAVALLRRGDQAALEQALALLQNTVFSFSMRVCGQREDAEDTMQEVLLKSVPYLPKFDSPKALVVWLYKVAKNRCLMSRRKSKFAPARELSLEELMPGRGELEQLSADGSINPEAYAIHSENASRLREAIQRLPAQYRIVLVLRDMEGLTDDEVAEITGLRPGTVRVRLHRARLFVRKELMSALKPRKLKPPAPVISREEAPRPAKCKQMLLKPLNPNGNVWPKPARGITCCWMIPPAGLGRSKLNSLPPVWPAAPRLMSSPCFAKSITRRSRDIR